MSQLLLLLVFFVIVLNVYYQEHREKIPDITVYRVHRFGKMYIDKTSWVKCKSIFIWFMIFRHRTMFYHNRKNVEHNVKVKLNLTKKLYSILNETMQLVNKSEIVNFVLADIYCHVKVVFEDSNDCNF